MLNTIIRVLFLLIGSIVGFVVGRFFTHVYVLSVLVTGITGLALMPVFLYGQEEKITGILPRWSRIEALTQALLATGVLCVFLDYYSAASCAFVLCLLVQNQPIKITPPSTRTVEPPSSSTSEPASILIVGADSSIRDVA